MIINKLKKELNIYGINTEKISKLHGGINSGVFKIETQTEKYVLKIYNNKKTNNIDRFYNEANFLEFLSKCKFRNVPRIIKTNKKKNWILISWIEGDKIYKVNKHVCKELVDFSLKLQEKRYFLNLISEI